MDIITNLKNKIINGEQITAEEALLLYDSPLESLCDAANEIRAFFCENTFDICTIINAKSGRCSENCKFCAQSSLYPTDAEEYPLLDADTILRQAKYNDEQGILRYSLVTSGKSLTDSEIDQMCNIIKAICRETDIAVCVSFGLLREDQFKRLKTAGVSRVHNNLETARAYFPNVCTTHCFEDKVTALKAAQNAGLTVCSGGIMGMGESPADRIDMAITLRELGIRSIPVNILYPIPGTPYEHKEKLTDDEVRRIVAVYRFILPDAFIRLAGGRGLLSDKGKACFQSGANAAISGGMLTTAGISVDADMALLKELEYTVGTCDG